MPPLLLGRMGSIQAFRGCPPLGEALEEDPRASVPRRTGLHPNRKGRESACLQELPPRLGRQWAGPQGQGHRDCRLSCSFSGPT